MTRDPASDILTIVPLENHKGERLQVCPDCFGRGTAYKARYACGLPDGRKFKAGQPLTEDDRKRFDKRKLGVEYSDCTRCAGAGMAKAGEAVA